MKWLKCFMLCRVLGNHDWTSRAQQGIPPTREQLSTPDGFWDYAKMFCRRCGRVSRLNDRIRLTSPRTRPPT